MLMASAVDHLEKKYAADINVAVAYIYCNYKERGQHTTHNLKKSILSQIYRYQPAAGGSTNDPIQELYERHTRRATQLSSVEVDDAFKRIIPLYSQIFILVDAVDELHDDEQCIFLSFLAELTKSFPRIIKLMAMSRSFLSDLQASDRMTTSRMEVVAQECDVKEYIKEKLGMRPRLLRLVKIDPTLASEIIERITNRYGGM